MVMMLWLRLEIVESAYIIVNVYRQKRYRYFERIEDYYKISFKWQGKSTLGISFWILDRIFLFLKLWCKIDSFLQKYILQIYSNEPIEIVE